MSDRDSVFTNGVNIGICQEIDLIDDIPVGWDESALTEDLFDGLP